MPDGDRVHPGLARQYQKVYKQICEGTFSDASLASEATEALKRELKRGGDAPAHLMDRIADRMDQLPKEPLFRSQIDWPAMSREIDHMVTQAGVQKRMGSHIAEVSKGLLYELRQDGPAPNTHTRLMERTLNNIYRSEFEERVPLAQHYDGASQASVQARLDEMRPYVQRTLAAFARQASRRSSFQHLRRAPIAHPKISPHDTDVLSLS